MRRLIAVLLLIIISISAQAQKYVFYLHGRIVEEMGPNAIETDNGYGAYEYYKILDAFRNEHFTVLSEVRAKNTDPKTYAQKIVKQIDSLISKGAKPNQITVIGASKGSVITQYVSTFLKNKQVNFVIMGGCFNDIATSMPDINYYGNILSIYEKSDAIGQSCATIQKRSANTISHYKETELNTGLRHGYLYKPLKEWILPATKWANGNYE